VRRVEVGKIKPVVAHQRLDNGTPKRVVIVHGNAADNRQVTGLDDGLVVDSRDGILGIDIADAAD